MNSRTDPQILGLTPLLGAALVAWAAEGGPSNLAEFGLVSVVKEGTPGNRVDVPALARAGGAAVVVVPGSALRIEWTHPRAVKAVHVRFGNHPPKPDELSLEWWRRIWPDNGTGGWMKLDDPFNGQWTAVRSNVTTNDSELRFQFAPLDAAEAPGSKRTGLDHRVTYKLRLSCARAMNLAHIGVFSDAVTRRARLRFEWNRKTTVPGHWAPSFEARNGRILERRMTGKDTSVVELEYADAADRLSTDRGYVVCRSGETRSFSVFVDDVRREGGLFVRDIGAFVSDADQNLTFPTWAGPGGEAWKEGTVAEQVARLPEQTFEQVKKAIPLKPPPYMFLGVPNLRQEIALLPQGEIQLRADSLRSDGPDAALRPWKWDDLVYQFGLGEHPVMGPKSPSPVTRRLEEGWLPAVEHATQTKDIACQQTSVAVPLVGTLAGLVTQTGTETVALATRIQLRNTASSSRTAWLWLELNHPLPWRLAVDGTLVLDLPSDGRDRPSLVAVRGRFNIFGKGALDLAVLVPGGPGSHNPALNGSAAAREAVRYRVELAPGETHAIEFLTPYVELLDTTELTALKALTFTNAHESVVAFWKERVTRGMTLEVPEPYLNELFKANLWHVLISTDVDPVTGHHQHGAATHAYPNFLNETAMVARSLEMRGEHEAAFRLLEPFLASQSAKGLPGNFQTKAGVLYAAQAGEPDPYTAQGYNLHHGWGMWLAAEHYYWSRDRDYLLGNAKRLIQAGDWVTFERQATKFLKPDRTRPIEYGLAPAGDLEDVEEYLYYYATDAYYYLGMKHIAAALAAASSGQAPLKPGRSQAAAAARLAKDAATFRNDLRASVAESVATSPVVRLRDGTYIPYVPPRAYALTHRKEGWIREGLYPALHLVNGEVYEERHPFVEWMIQELEDNIFLSAESGYGVAEPKTNFFNLGGFTLQPNLLDLPLAYLKRDQPENFLRAFYNTAWASLYPETMCFAEWVPALGQGGGPLYKTPDECKFIQWLRQMLVLERGDALELGLGMPRAWMAEGQRVKLERAATYFGQLDLEVVSRVAAGQISATIQLAPSVWPKALRLRLRHPAGKAIQSARVNGKPAPVNTERQMIELPLGVARWEVSASF